MKKLFASFTSALAIFAFSLPFSTNVKSAEFFTIGTGGKISGTIAEMSDEDFSKSKIKLVKDEEENKKSGGGFFGTAKEEDK